MRRIITELSENNLVALLNTIENPNKCQDAKAKQAVLRAAIKCGILAALQASLDEVGQFSYKSHSYDCVNALKVQTESL